MDNGKNPNDSTGPPPGSLNLSVDSFRAELEVFSGPLDLLLYLIKQKEVDVLEIEISEITDQYLIALQTFQAFDVNVAAEFLVMAATLMDIKSRSLLPESIDEDEEQEDPGDQLVHQLLQYKRFKKAANRLQDLAAHRAMRYNRIPPEPQLDQPQKEPSLDEILEDVGLWELVSAYAEVVRQIEMSQPHQIVYDEVPVATYIEEVVETLDKGEGRVQFLELFRGDRSRARVIGIFLALLELAKQKKIELHQPEEGQTHIWIERAATEEADINEDSAKEVPDDGREQ